MFKLHDSVRFVEDIPLLNIKKHTKGIIIRCFSGGYFEIAVNGNLDDVVFASRENVENA